MYRASALSLYRAWESFNEARSADDAEERETRLDKFLALLHHYRWKGNLCLFELEKICPAMNAGACNVLARELLTDIHQLCRNLAEQSSSSPGGSASVSSGTVSGPQDRRVPGSGDGDGDDDGGNGDGDEDEEEEEEVVEDDEEEERRQEQRRRRRESGHVTALADYLLAGRGFTLLLTLDSLLNQELACREDLLNLLLSLLPLLWKIPVREEQARAYHLPPLGENLFSAGSSQASSQPQPSPSRKGTAFPLLGRYNCSGGSAGRKHRRHRKGGPGHEARDKAQAPHASTDSELSSSERPTAAATLLANWRQVAPNRSLASTGLFTSEDFSPPKPGGSYPLPLGESLERFGCGGAAMEEQATRLADVEAHVQPSIETEVQRLPVCELDVVNANDPSGLALGLGRDAHVADGTPFELCRVLLSLLGKLCEAELASATRGQASVCTVLPSLLRFLSALGGGDRNLETGVMAAGWTGETVAFVQRMLLHAVLRLLTATNAALHGEADGMPDTLRSAALDLLNAAHLAKLGLERPRAEPFAPRLKRTLKEVQQQEEEEKLALYKCLEPQDDSKSRYHWLLLLPELIHATLQLMLRYVQAAGSNPFLLNQAVDLIQEFVKQQGFDLLQESLVDLEALVSSVATQQQQRQHHLLLPSPSLPMGALEVRDARVYIRILVDDITEVISALKKARVEQVNPAGGHRKRHHHQPFHHRACPQPSCPQEHHHSDLSGLPMCAFTPSRMPLNPFEEQDNEGREDAASLGATGKTTDGLCCVAVFSARCLAMLESVQTSEIALRVLSGTSGAGVCCCLDLHSALSPILRSLWSPVGAGSKAYQQYALAVLGKLLLDQLGGNHQGNVDGKPKPSTVCQICESADDDGSGLDSAAQSGGSSPSSAHAVNRPRRWEALAAYRGPVLGEAGPGAALLVARHLCHLARRGGPELRRQLYVHVLSPAIRQGVEATQHARQLGLGGEAAAGGCVHACHLHARCPSPQLIRKCLEAVPVLLQHRSLLELFLVSDGLSQVTELLFLEEVRPAALAVFHTLILALEGQGPEEAEGPEPVQRSEALQRDAANSAHLAPDSPQSGEAGAGSRRRLSRLCAGLRDGHVTPMRRKKSHGDGSPEFHHNNHHHHQHHHNQHHHQQRAADLFLCVTLLSVTRDEGGEDSTDRDSEDTSGYDSTPCVCVGERYGASSLPRLSPDCAALPTSDGEVRLAADVWASCRRLCQASLAFRGRLARSGALQVCRRLAAIIIKDLSPSPGAPRHDGLAGRRPKAAPAAEDNDAGASAALPRTQSNTSSDFSSTEQLTTEVHVAAAALSESSETITQQEPADGEQTLDAEGCDGSSQRPPDDDGDDADAPDAEVTPTSEAGDGWPASCRSSSIGTSKSESVGQRLDGHAARAADGHVAPDVKREATSNNEEGRWCACETERTDRPDRPELVKIRLLEALLAVCLHGCTLTGGQQRDNDLPGQGFSTKDLLKELWGLLAESGLLATELARPLCEALLRVALTGGPPDDVLLDFDDKKRADEELFPLDGEWSADPFDDPEEVKGMQPEHSPGGGCSGEEGGYEADSESNPDDNTEEGSKDESAPRLAPGPAFPLGMDGGPAACASPQPLPGQLAYPELCVLVLKLLAAVPLELPVATRVFRTLLEIARGGEQNRAALYQQGVVKTLLIGFTALLGQADPAMRECQTALVDLLVAMTTSHMSSEELTLLLRLFSEQRPPTELLLSGLSQVVQANTQAVPSHFLSFPTAQGGGAALHAMARVATAGVKARAASPVQRAFQEFLRCTRPDPSRKEDGGGGAAPRGPASPWVVSSVRLALPAEHQAWGQQHTGRPAGFSASLWLRVGWGPGGEDSGAAAAGGAGERVRRSKKNRLLVFRDSSIDSPEGERVVVIDYPNPHKAGDRMVDEGLLHLLSFGSRSLMLQVWAEPDAGLLTFRVVVDAGDGKKVDLLAQAETAEDVLALGQWQHLALSYQQRPEGKRNAHGRLAVWIDGCRVSEMALDFVVPPARKPTSPADAQRLYCLLGHSVGSQEEAERLLGSWSLGNLMVFYDAILTPEFAFHLFACGPDTRSILPCKQRSPAPVYSKYVTLAMLEGGNLKDLLACSSEFNVSPLVMNLCLTYCPSHPTRYTVYDFPASAQSRVPGRAPPPVKAPSPRDIKLVPDGPEVLRAPQPSSHRGLQSSVYKIGGTSAFIFLFARVVELSESEATQAKALEVALSLARRHQKRVQEMSDCHGYAMIYEVLTKKRCLVGFHTLKVLLEACCDGVVLRWSRERSRFELERESDAVIQDVELLSSILLAWNVWMRAPAGVWETLLTALEILIRPNHPAQMFNIQQLLRAKVVDQLLLTCQVLQENRSEGSANLPLAVSHSFVKIIGEVLGSPPDAALLASVCRFLLAVHPPDATYVCHASVGFYFTLRANGRALDERISAISALRRDQAQSSTPLMSPATAPGTTFPFHPATIPPASRGSARDSVDLVDAQPDVGRVQPASSGGGGGSPRLRRQRAMRQREASLDELREVSEHESDTPSAAILRESRSTRARARRASGGGGGSGGGIVNSGGAARPKAGADPGPTIERGGDASLPSDRAVLRGTVEESLPDRDSVRVACSAAGVDQSAGPAATGLDNCAAGGSSAGRECHSEILKRKCGVGRRVADTESSLSPSSSSSSSNVSEHVRGPFATADAFAAARQRSRHEHQPVGEAAGPAPDARVYRRSNTNEFSAEGTVDESSGGPSEQEGMGEQTVSDGSRVPRLQRMMSRHWDLGLAFPGSGAGLGSSKGMWKSSTSLGEWDTVSGATTASGSNLSLGSPTQHCSVPEDGLMLVCCGLYHLLQGVLLNLPDSMLPLVTEQLLTAETLLVLANHRSPLQRLAVVKLLDVYFQRVSDDQKAAFVKMHGLYLLANQLHQRAATHGLAEALLSMLLACPSALDEELELQAVRECPSFQRRWGVPLLALAESSLHDTPLAHNLLCALLQLFGACTRLADVLLDSGLLSTLCNIVALLTGIAEGGLAQWECRLLLGDVQQLLVAATIHACSTGGGQYLRLLDDLVVLLNCLQGSANPRTQGVAVALQFRVLQAAVDLVRSVADTESQAMTSSFVLPSAPHHALQQKRRSIAGTSVVRDSIIPRQPRQRLAPFAFPTGSPPLGRPDASLLCTLGHDAGAGASMAPQSDTLLLMRMRSVASDELSRLVQRRMSQDNSLRAPEAELIQRLQRVTVMAVNRILFQDPVHDEIEFADLPMTPSAGQPPSIHCGSPLSDEEDRAEWPMAVSTRLAFQRQIFHMMLDGLKISVECGKSNAPRQQWRRILWACRETFRAQLGRLLVHVLSPLRSPTERRLGLEVVAEPNCKEILRETLSSPPQHGPKLALYVSELLREQAREGRTLGRKEQRAAEVLLNLLRQCGYKSVPPGAPPKDDVVEAVREEREKFQKEEESNREAWVRRMTTNGQALLGRIETRARSVSRVAAEVTQRVAGRQGLERKKVIAHIREAYKAELSAQRCWQTLFRQLTHERVVWFFPVACPSSWQLDPTEGPNRERRRLQRCHITIPNKYLLKDRWTSAADAIKLPLSFLFDDKSSSSGSSAVKDKATSEPTKFTRRCISVVPSRETPGELLLGETGMHFVEDSTGDATETPSCVGEAEALSFSWTYEDIKEVHLRWWQLRDNALEVFLTNGRTLLLTFDSTKVRDQVYQTILSSDLPNLLEYGNLSALTQLWCAGQITNFEYLTHLNKHAGRSFNDLMQYPVFPFVLRDYASETLDLADPRVYRNLVKPIAVQCKEKEDRYINNYKWLEEEYRKGGREDDPMPPVQPYHYGSHYSNSGTVLHFLVRLPPFTKMFLAYQDQSFDIPDRTFHSMATTWRLSSYESTTDVKELVPEFFYLPEFLANREGFDFGLRQNGDRVNHVTLPLWARGDPRLFVLLQRQALESENVSLSLCHWIDLVFGHKQKGKAAVQAINVFHPATYFGMDVSAVEDPVQRRALETMIKTYGQTPRQLFSSQHPARGAPRSPVEADITSAMGMLVQLAFRETREITRDHARETVAPSPLPWIKGLRWGEYVGSPSCPDPMVCFSQPHPGQRFGSLLALPTRVVCGLAPNFCLMMTYSKEQGVRSMHNTDIHWSAILSWGYADNILRLKSKQTEPPVSFIQCDAADQVSSCAWVPDGCQLFTGNQEGVVTAYVTRFSAATPSELEVESCVHLYGHTDAVALLHVCKPYSVLVSASIDGTCIIWDLNRLCYVQSLTGHKSPVMAVSASETTGDIATACSSVGGGSDLRLWTVNGDLIGHVHSPEMVRSLAFSNQPEGTSVNVIAGGLETGVVRLWSTWDLKPVREIAYPKSGLAVISLTFSCDGLHLFTVDSEGKVVAWCRRDHARSKPPLFYSFLGSFSA